MGKVAYFSMEIMIESFIPTYSGGLGILAGDTLRAASDLKLPVVGVTLNYSRGFFHQEITNDGWQEEHRIFWDPKNDLERLEETVEVQIEGKTIRVGAWKYRIIGKDGHEIPVILLDTNVEGNSPEDRQISKQLYDANPKERIRQEIILGVAGVRMLRALGYAIDTYHLNEGHATFLTLELLKENQNDVEEVRKQCVFTTHTPVPAGHDRFPYEIVGPLLGDLMPANIKELASKEELHMTKLAMNLSRKIIAVSKKHCEVTTKMFPEHEIDYVTNGVNLRTFISRNIHDVLEETFPGYLDNPALLKDAQKLDSAKLWEAHMRNKEDLAEMAIQRGPVGLSKNKLTIGFARRFAPYKRPSLILKDVERLKKICDGKVQFVFAGKTHPNDHQGKLILQYVHKTAHQLHDSNLYIAFLENYSVEMAKKLVSGVDVWLNNPSIPNEASGTSGMKAAANGAINFSTKDGWWIEAVEHDPESGFTIGSDVSDDVADANAMYELIEHTILPEFYAEPDGFKERWVERMKRSIALAATYNAQRMVRQYAEKLWECKVE